MAADGNSDQGREYNRNESFCDKKQSVVRAVVSCGQHITVEIENNIALMRETLM